MFDLLSQKFTALFSGISRHTVLTESLVKDTMRTIQDALIDADVPHALVQEFTSAISQKAIGQKIQKKLKADEQLAKIVHDMLLDFFGGELQKAFTFTDKSVVMIVGLQGAGKTTTIAKLAYAYQKNNPTKRALIGSVDYYRPAAIDQLEQLSQQAQVAFYRSTKSSPIDAASDIYDHFKKESYDIMFLDTAGRLHVDATMLAEIQEIDTYLNPRHKVLVLDSMTGQESLSVAQAFNNAIAFEGAILTKADSDSRGGAAFAFRYALKKPILFVCSGEKLEDIAPFYPQRAVNRMLGMGDVHSLIERANEKIKQEEQEASYQAFMSGRLTLEDFAQQMDMMNRIGSLSSILKYLPGIPAQAMSPDAIAQGELQMKKFKVIIQSMTRKERLNPSIIDDRRIERISRGSGSTGKDVRELLKHFKEMQQYAKIFSNTGMLKRFFR